MDAAGKAQPTFTADITDEEGEVVAQVEKVLSVRRRPASASAREAARAQRDA